jgi:hypothetical protein
MIPEFQEYQFWKIKNFLKKQKILFFFNSSRIKHSNWLEAEKLSKKCDVNYHTINNNATLNLIKISVYKNIYRIVNCMLLVIQQKTKNLSLFFNSVNDLKPLFEPVALKLNNKIYLIEQLETLKILNFKKNIKSFQKVLKTYNRLCCQMNQSK